MPRRALSFFFQAEDGIRGWSVTGVQTCALPISRCGLGRVKRPGRTPHTGLLTDERQLFVVRSATSRTKAYAKSWPSYANGTVCDSTRIFRPSLRLTV